MRLVDADALTVEFLQYSMILRHRSDFVAVNLDAVLHEIRRATTIDAVPVEEIRAYLQSKLDEWNALGDRRFEPANMWGYNFIMACFDDLARIGR